MVIHAGGGGGGCPEALLVFIEGIILHAGALQEGWGSIVVSPEDIMLFVGLNELREFVEKCPEDNGGSAAIVDDCGGGSGGGGCDGCEDGNSCCCCPPFDNCELLLLVTEA